MPNSTNIGTSILQTVLIAQTHLRYYMNDECPPQLLKASTLKCWDFPFLCHFDHRFDKAQPELRSKPNISKRQMSLAKIAKLLIQLSFRCLFGAHSGEEEIQTTFHYSRMRYEASVLAKLLESVFCIRAE